MSLRMRLCGGRRLVSIEDSSLKINRRTHLYARDLLHALL
jgi:hypothetical protein